MKRRTQLTLGLALLALAPLALAQGGDIYREVNHLILLKNPGGKWIKRDLMG